MIFFVKQKTAYELRISDWSSDVCSSDLPAPWRLWLYGRISDRAHVDQCARRPDLRRHRRNHENPDRPRFVAATLRRCEMTIKARVAGVDRKSVVSGKSVAVRVDLGGGRIIKKKKKRHRNEQNKK